MQNTLKLQHLTTTFVEKNPVFQVLSLRQCLCQENISEAGLWNEKFRDPGVLLGGW